MVQGERYLYTLRAQVKDAFLKIQKAQVSERKAAESKRRLTSYIFHEVRLSITFIPLKLIVLRSAYRSTLPVRDSISAS